MDLKFEEISAHVGEPNTPVVIYRGRVVAEDDKWVTIKSPTIDGQVQNGLFDIQKAWIASRVSLSQIELVRWKLLVARMTNKQVKLVLKTDNLTTEKDELQRHVLSVSDDGTEVDTRSSKGSKRFSIAWIEDVEIVEDIS